LSSQDLGRLVPVS